MNKIGVLLSGCGYLDGAEIRESVFTLLALDELGLEAVFISINKSQHHVINHFNSAEEKSKRSLLEESARIARGKITDINQVDTSELKGLIIPGGFGVAKNFSTFAFEGAKASVIEEVEKLILDIHEQKKPIGALCIAPALLSLILGSKGLKCTIGTDKETAQAIEQTGAKHINSVVTESIVDRDLKVSTTAAYMFADASAKDIYKGIKSCIHDVLEMI